MLNPTHQDSWLPLRATRRYAAWKHQYQDISRTSSKEHSERSTKFHQEEPFRILFGSVELHGETGKQLGGNLKADSLKPELDSKWRQNKHVDAVNASNAWSSHGQSFQCSFALLARCLFNQTTCLIAISASVNAKYSWSKLLQELTVHYRFVQMTKARNATS